MSSMMRSASTGAGANKAAALKRCAVTVRASGNNVAVSTQQQAETKVVNEAVEPLFTPFKMGRFQLEHRMVYPPLTRCRASEDSVPQFPLMAEYYSQRATKGGLMISEGTYVSNRAAGYPTVSGIYNDVQRDAWKPIIQAVHDKGAIFFCQLWHTGRVAPPALIGGQTPVAPSPIAPGGNYGKAYIGNGQFQDLPVPEELSKEGIKEVVEQFRQAARRAVDGGFDGVELHGANGYLIAQFTNSRTNKRTDEYGGSIENRCRFALEVTKAVVDEIGADRVGYRASPFTDFLDCIDEESPYATYMYLTEQLNKFGLAYLHMVEARLNGNAEVENTPDSLEPFRKVWRGPFIAAGAYTADNAGPAVASGHTDLVAFGRLWIANPDLPKRFKLGAPLNPYDRDTFYSPGPKGYIDYPFLEDN